MHLTDIQKFAIITSNSLINVGSHPALLDLYLLCSKIIGEDVAKEVKKNGRKELEKQCNDFFHHTVTGEPLSPNMIDTTKKPMSRTTRFKMNEWE